ncbi:DUF2849 domain-containing protein [Aureimonas flava]|uniref:DUF2849 domain-containing protein n=1 Tax=Aureimonas flava TaxID=2320271 RepID=A0A3A1WP08_9HYPH|nr:DUF2849 domain-containing protein [Aureimonas flava]RIY02475.1 DUF2849 domain-containing protein [Aureimonas flava]
MAGEVKAGAKSKGPKLPVIMSANDLLDGEVVFLTREGWTLDPRAALVADDAETAAWMEEEGRRGVGENRIVDPYLVAVSRDAGGLPVASHFREAIRQKGPTMLPQYGKQAEF